MKPNKLRRMILALSLVICYSARVYAVDNELSANQTGTGSNILFSSQEGGTGNEAIIFGLANGGNNVANITQHHDANSLIINQQALGNFASGNMLTIEQSIDNKIVLNQMASNVGGINTASIIQDFNSPNVGDNLVKLDQTAALFNIVTITQYGGNNILAGVLQDGTIDVSSNAVQTSLTSNNQLILMQTGGYNEVGLYQVGEGANLATINQSGGGNSLGVYQTNSGGTNVLTASQTGNANRAIVQQISHIGTNTVIVNQ
jgi:hypothetical protein